MRPAVLNVDVFANTPMNLLISLGIVTKKAFLNMGEVCCRVLSLADSGNLLSLERNPRFGVVGLVGHIRPGRCELPPLPLPPFLPCGLRAALVHVHVAGIGWLGRVCCSRQLFLSSVRRNAVGWIVVSTTRMWALRPSHLILLLKK